MTIPRTPSFRLDHRRAIVAGASSGIGRAAALALAQAGARVTLVARRPEALAQVRGEIGETATALPLDITDIAAAEAAVAAHGPFDILVNSAGLARHSPALDTTPADYDAVTDVNLRAAYFLTRAVARGLIDAAKPGSLINVSSQMGHVGGPDRALYCATKHALEGMTKSMAIEWGRHGIRVNTLCPTFIRTPLAAVTLEDPEKTRLAGIEDQAGPRGRGRGSDGPGGVPGLGRFGADDRRVAADRRRLVCGMIGKVTSHDVARLAGVSQSAVSRVFSGASASPETIAKVRKAARELKYRPNPLARAMITGKSRIIGLVVAYLDNPFYPMAVERLSKALQARGYHILVFLASNAGDEVDGVVQDLLGYRVDGIIMASVAIGNDVTRRCADNGIPVVMFNRGQDGEGPSAVTSANVEGGRKVARFLAGGGHRRIAHIAGWQGASTGRDRARGFAEELTALGTAPVAVIDGMYDRTTAAAAARTLMGRTDPPDAIFVGNDHMAFAVLDTLRGELGLRVPDDVSVVGYDDVPQAEWAAYRLTTVRQPIARMVEATVDTLLAEIDDVARPTQKIEIAGPLQLRDTARIPEGWTDEGL